MVTCKTDPEQPFNESTYIIRVTAPFDILPTPNIQPSTKWSNLQSLVGQLRNPMADNNILQEYSKSRLTNGNPSLDRGQISKRYGVKW